MKVGGASAKSKTKTGESPFSFFIPNIKPKNEQIIQKIEKSRFKGQISVGSFFGLYF